MMFLLFIFLLFAIARFHRREHRLFIQELAAMAARGRVDGGDWRVISQEHGEYLLRRAFRVQTREDALRYFAPIVFFCICLLALQNWGLAFAYLAALAVKWFATITRLKMTMPDAKYAVELGKYRLFGEVLPNAQGGAKLSPSGETTT